MERQSLTKFMKSKKGVDMQALTRGAIGVVVVVVAIAIGVVITDKLSQTAGLGVDAQNVANNGTGLLGDILTDWGAIIILGLVLIAVLAPLLFALIQVGRQGSR